MGHDRPAQLVEHSQSKVVHLPRIHRLVKREMLAQEDRFLMVFDLQIEVGVDPTAIFGEDVERVAERRLVNDQQADQAEVRKLPMLGHSEAKGHASRCVGAVFQQVDDRSGREHLFGVVHHRSRQARALQHRRDVELQFACDGEIAGQRCRPDELHSTLSVCHDLFNRCRHP